jgi:aerobic-type carbon monoxide dehydrogenase small subunit (CoxS/CutS family)
MEIVTGIEQAARVKVKFRLNGVTVEKAVPIGWTLLKYLRDGLGLTGTKCGCEVGECGACTILYNGKAVNSCLILAAQIDSAEIWTIEGVTLTAYDELHPVQRAFIECDAVHCGFCSPGMIMATIALLLKTTNPSDDEIKTALAGNLCRCTGYIQIIEAVRLAASKITEEDLNKFRLSS